jgi:muramoyltetrapeptide carboxypeptidase
MQTISSFKRALFGKELRYLFPSSIHNRNALSSLTKGIEGQMVGGNLSILTSMLGSNSQLSTDGKILFIEEIGEYKYSIDRMLQSLKRAGYFTNVKAVIAGNISAIKKNSTKWGSSIEQLILAVVPEDVPVFFDFPAGHEADNRTIIFGRNVQLIKAGENFSLVFKEI